MAGCSPYHNNGRVHSRFHQILRSKASEFCCLSSRSCGYACWCCCGSSQGSGRRLPVPVTHSNPPVCNECMRLIVEICMHILTILETSMAPLILLHGVQAVNVLFTLNGPITPLPFPRSPSVQIFSLVMPLISPFSTSGTAPQIAHGSLIMATASESVRAHATPVSFATFWYWRRRATKGHSLMRFALGPGAGSRSCKERRQRLHRSSSGLSSKNSFPSSFAWS
mmetsp:Transcript_5136/g.9713  ORF Transcript_5136/g.9713 Transcript_5136/m.9713 type:complete len:224 (+) Transcript_5136:364-1035(+)